ncbi:MAG: PIN domain-containing protein [bacterium]|nr:PIN domain-containing protein [bacterium]
MLIVDTAPLVAAPDSADPMHQRCLALLETHPGPLVTAALVITEAGWLIRRQLDTAAEAVFYTAISQGQLNTEPLTSTDWARITELLDTYSNISLDAADASIVAIAERLDQTVIATLDERDFRIIRPDHAAAFEPSKGYTGVTDHDVPMGLDADRFDFAVAAHPAGEHLHLRPTKQ